jgi:cob(I)alamin adenosyltransferase
MDINVDPRSLREMQSALFYFNADLTTDRRDLQALLSSIRWDDSRFDEFKGQMDPALSHIEGVSMGINEMVFYLEDKAAVIEQYLGR